MTRPPPRPTLFPYTPLFRSRDQPIGDVPRPRPAIPLRDRGPEEPELAHLGDDPAIETLMPVRLRSEEHTSELQSQSNLVCRLLLEKKKKKTTSPTASCSPRP